VLLPDGEAGRSWLTKQQAGERLVPPPFDLLGRPAAFFGQHAVGGVEVGLGASGVAQQAEHVTGSLEQSPVRCDHGRELAGGVTGRSVQVGARAREVGR